MQVCAVLQKKKKDGGKGRVGFGRGAIFGNAIILCFFPFSPWFLGLGGFYVGLILLMLMRCDFGPPRSHRSHRMPNIAVSLCRSESDASNKFQFALQWAFPRPRFFSLVERERGDKTLSLFRLFGKASLALPRAVYCIVYPALPC